MAVVCHQPLLTGALVAAFDNAGLPARGFSGPADFRRRRSMEPPPAVVVDLDLPALAGVELLHAEARQGVPVVVFSEDDDALLVEAALGAGARALISRSVGLADLVETTCRVLAGWSQPVPESAGVRMDFRTRLVLQRLALGYTSEEVADSLAVSLRVVEATRQQLSELHGLESRRAFVAFARDHGLIS